MSAKLRVLGVWLLAFSAAAMVPAFVSAHGGGGGGRGRPRRRRRGRMGWRRRLGRRPRRVWRLWRRRLRRSQRVRRHERLPRLDQQLQPRPEQRVGKVRLQLESRRPVVAARVCGKLELLPSRLAVLLVSVVRLQLVAQLLRLLPVLLQLRESRLVLRRRGGGVSAASLYGGLCGRQRVGCRARG